MKRKTARRLAVVLLVLMFVLLVTSQMIHSNDLLTVAALMPIIAVLIEMKFDHCSYCGAYLGKTWGHYCPHCHQPLMDDEE